MPQRSSHLSPVHTSQPSSHLSSLIEHLTHQVLLQGNRRSQGPLHLGRSQVSGDQRRHPGGSIPKLTTSWVKCFQVLLERRQNVPAGGREPGSTIKNVNQGPHPVPPGPEVLGRAQALTSGEPERSEAGVQVINY